MVLGQVEVRIRLDGRIRGHTRVETQGWIKDAAQLIADDAKVNAPYKTGHLVNSIQSVGITSQSGIVISAADYSAAQEDGSSRGIEGHKYMENAMNKAKSLYGGKLIFEKVI